MPLSPSYYAALEAAKRHHAASKTYSGKLVRTHWAAIGDMVRRLGCKTLLDYGCGKGLQYEWVNPRNGLTLEQDWGVAVTKYDPAWPPFAAEPDGQFDLVLVAHVLGSIPIEDLPAIVERLHGLASKGIFVAERIVEPKKRVFDHIEGMPRGWTREDWARVLARPDSPVETLLSTVTVTDAGDICERATV